MKRLIFLGYVAVEIAAFVGLTYAVGILWALVATLATMVLSFWLLRRQGVKVFRELAQASRGEVEAARPAADAVLLALSTGLLIVPGLVTTSLGILLLIKPVRALARMALVALGTRKAMTVLDRAGAFTAGCTNCETTVVDGEVVTTATGTSWGTIGPRRALD